MNKARIVVAKKWLLGTGFFLPAVPECDVIIDKKGLDYGYSKF